MGTHDFFKTFHFVYRVVMQAGLAKIHFMLTVADINTHISLPMLLYRSFTNLASLYITDTMNCLLHLLFNGLTKLRWLSTMSLIGRFVGLRFLIFGSKDALQHFRYSMLSATQGHKIAGINLGRNCLLKDGLCVIWVKMAIGFFEFHF